MVEFLFSLFSTFYPFYSVTDDRWKNSIRHNLSLYPEFLKGSKTEQSAGHLWYLDKEFREKQEKEERAELDTVLEKNENKKVGDIEDIVDDVIGSEKTETKIPWFFQDQSRFLSNSTSIELQKSAAEILSGIKRPTAVEENVCFPMTFTSSQDDLYHHCWRVPYQDEKRET